MKKSKSIIIPGKPERARSSTHLADILAAYRARPFSPGVYEAQVYHDSWCALLANRGPCNCNPDIRIA